MLLRLPWLLSRKRLLAAVMVDSCLFSLIYSVAFKSHYGRWPALSLPVAALVSWWLLSSYVVGRYQVALTSDGGQALEFVLRTGVVLVLTLGVCLGYFGLNIDTLGARDSYGLLVTLLVAFAFLSTLIQYILARIIYASAKHPRQWVLLGTADTLNVLTKHLVWRRLPAVLLMPTELPSLQELVPDDYSGVLVSDLNAVPSSQQQQLLQLQHKGFLVLSLVGWCERVLQRFPPELLTNVDLLYGEFSINFGTLQFRLKRLGDVLVSLCLLALTLPILIIAAVLIRLQDGGPVLFSQLRSGLNSKPYRIWKLRTMRVDSERHGAQWVCKDDSRITHLGRLLRVTRLDELPQLWAVLQGEMSLIGPRPERPEFEKHLEHQIPHYRLRHLMRPGLSGWAQVNYPYGASVEDAANKLSYDLYYLRNFSFWLDLLILFKTIRLVFNAQGAVPISSETKPGG